jgi:SAM-dependent methyltransferase
MGIGPPLRFFVSVVSLTWRRDGFAAATAAGAGLIWAELRKLPRLIRLRAMPSTGSPFTAISREAPRAAESMMLELGAVRRAVAEHGINMVSISLDPAAMGRHMNDYRYPRTYAGGSVQKGGAREAKILEYFATLELLDINSTAVVIDVASERSLFPDVLRVHSGARVFRQDLIYPPGIEDDRIGCDAAAMPLPADFADLLTLHNSFEHFEGATDTKFVQEAWRVLRPGGKLFIVPLFLSEQYDILTDPLVDTDDVVWDSGANVVSVVGYRNRFGRFYSFTALANRVVEPAMRCGFTVTLIHFTNATDLVPILGPYLGLLLSKPRDARPGVSSPVQVATTKIANDRDTTTISLVAFVLAATFSLIIATDVGQPARAISVLAFLGIAPLLVFRRFAPKLDSLELAVVATASGVAAYGILAGLTLAVRIWEPIDAVLVLATALGLAAAFDVGLSWRRRWRGERHPSPHQLGSPLRARSRRGGSSGTQGAGRAETASNSRDLVSEASSSRRRFTRRRDAQ